MNFTENDFRSPFLLIIMSRCLNYYFIIDLKVASATFLLLCFLSLKESNCETRKNVFYFTSKALCSWENQNLEL